MKYLAFLLILFSSCAIQAQTVTGYWYGQANVEMAGMQNNYLTELIISQKGTRVKGFFGYYFKDVYQSFVVKGTYDPKTRRIVINDIPIIYFQTNSTMNSVDCITSFYGTLRVSKVKTELLGHFYRDKKYTYTCPDLRVRYTLYTEAKVTDSIFKDMSSTRSFWKPQQPEPEVVKGLAARQESEMNAIGDPSVQAKNSLPQATLTGQDKNSTAHKQATTGTETQGNPALGGIVSGAATNPAGHNETSGAEKKQVPALADQPLVQPDIVRIKEEFKKRKQLVAKQIEVSSDSVRLSFYDNAEVDGDSISVFFNGKLVLAHQGLSERAFNVYILLDSSREINEVSMFAENLGKYPPNTALMVISDGDKRYETFLSSDYNGNATIRLKLRRNLVAGN